MASKNIYQDYAEDLKKYLTSKLPDELSHIVAEISEYIACKTANLIHDVIRERDNEWEDWNNLINKQLERKRRNKE